MQSNNLAPTFGTICYNGNSAFNILQQPQQPQQQLTTAQLNLAASNLLQQQQQQQQHQQQHQQYQEPIQKQNDTTFTKIFVGGLPYHTTDESLKIFFQKFGNIEEAVVINDRQTGKSRGYGFVTMETKEAAEAAIYDPNPVIDGRKANVNLAYLGVKSRSLAPSGIIPLAIRYQLPPSSAQATYGFHPFYYHPTGNTNVHQSQPTFTNTFLASTPNLLISAPAHNAQVASSTMSPNKTTLLSSAYDLNTAYAANGLNVANALNANRTSPFEPSIGIGPNAFLQSFNSNPSNGSINSILNSAQTNGSYFALPQNFSNPFQSQIQDRL